MDKIKWAVLTKTSETKWRVYCVATHESEAYEILKKIKCFYVKIKELDKGIDIDQDFNPPL